MLLKNSIHHHKSNQEVNSKICTSLSMHVKDVQRTMDWDGVKILQSENNLIKRKLLEGMYINISNTRNDRNVSYSIGQSIMQNKIIKHLLGWQYCVKSITW